MRTRNALARLALLVVVASSTPSTAQTTVGSSSTLDRPLMQLQTPPAPPEVPRLSLVLREEIPLPGPLPDSGVTVIDGRVLVPTSEGLVAIGESPDRRVEPVLDLDLVALPDGSGAEGWWASPGGRFRARQLQPDRLLAQRCCGWFRPGWHRAWRIRIPGGVSAPALIRDRLVFVPAYDNHIYAVRTRNGHRAWEHDVGEPLSRRLGYWTGKLPPAEPGDRPTHVELVLVVPRSGGRLLALDAASGLPVAGFRLGDDDDVLLGGPVTTPAGLIAVSRQGYVREAGGLLLFELVPLREDQDRTAEPGETTTPTDPGMS